MRSTAERASHLAALLATATGREPRTSEASELIRIEVDIPEDLSGVAHELVLEALSLAEDYGHERVGDRSYAWATLSKSPA